MKLTIKTNLVLSVLAIGLALHEQLSAQVDLGKSVLANGGDVLSASQYRILGTVGQPFIGVVQSASNANVGFWYLLTHKLSTGTELTTSSVPKEFRLGQNYPNPFNPTTTIQFALPKESRVKLEIYNVLGMRIATLADETRQGGYYSERFDATGLASGVYFYRLQAGDPSAHSGQWFVETKKLVLIR